MTDHLLQTRWLGRVNYAEALALQEEIVIQKRRDSTIADTILFLEHDGDYTMGRTPDQTRSRGASHLPHPLFQTNPCDQPTDDGPRQLMRYPIIDLSRCDQDLHKYLRWIEDLLIGFLAKFELSATRRTGLTGVWIDDRKIASIGVGVRHWITMHGFALNICGDLAPFAQITPCGLANVTMTSVERETDRKVTLAEAANIMQQLAQRRINRLRIEAGLQTISI